MVNSDPVFTALILAPSGRDAQVAGALMVELGLAPVAVPDPRTLVSRLGDDVALALVVEDSLRSADLRALAAWIETQPSWSDLPFILLTHRGGGPERNPAAARMSELLGNVSFLERPFHATTLISVVRTALRSRMRQFEGRQRILELDESERRLQTALSAGRLGAWELDLQTLTLTTSSTCKAIFGLQSEDSFPYLRWQATIHPDDQLRVESALDRSRLTGEDYAIEYRILWPDGSLHWVEIRAQAHHDRLGRPVKLVGVTADITERRREADKNRQVNEILEQRVAERTADLEAAHASVVEQAAQRQSAEEQLRQAQKMEAIGQLTGGVAHDFNNLLMAVLGNLELLRKHVSGDAKAERLIEGALQGARRGASLTQRMLAFARRQDLKIEAVDLATLLSDVEDLLVRSVGAMVQIEIDAPQGLAPVMADANQIELALLNLVVNARDAMPEGGLVTIALRQADVEASEELAAGRYVVLSVTDRGTGMDAETLKKAIEPFYSTKELGKGTGLGLSMIHGLARQLSGTLRLTSRLGEGTAAELWIPAGSEAAALRTEPVAEPVLEAAARVDQGPRRILLVDDDALIAMSSADMLLDLGHDVVEAHSGRDALEHLRAEGPFDLMITDYSMPGMTGGELAIAAREIAPTMPVLLATGYADLPPGVELDVPRLGKPYSQSQLERELQKIFSV
ncbi:PAS domain-containing protein [Rhizobium sp. YIM 134829]|uniref:PAS domain-containing protein n=1 Tax=Rhizobium sp. YIM 134829 TaxID=3390453 RepID=UPI00397A40F0